MPKVEKYVIKSLRAKVLARLSNQPQTSYATAASLSEFELKKILIDKIEENKSMNRSDIQKNLYNTLIESYNSDKDLFVSYGTKQRRSNKEESSKEATQKESKSTSSSKGASRSQTKSLGKSAQAEEHGPRVDDLEEPLHQEFNTGNDDVSPGPKRQRFYGYDTNMETLKDVYSRHKIIVVTSLKIMDFFGYKHLEEIIVRRQDDQLYRFREGDFKRLHRQDIEDMVRSSLVQDDMDINCLMRTNELYKFSDGTQTMVRTALIPIEEY
ncbi:hypothetical protein Tco_0400826 [Tanacetum coccineum]